MEDFVKASDSSQKLFLSNFIYQSNLIEGIDIDPIGTYNEGDIIKPIPELSGHYDALQYIIENQDDRSPTQEDIKNIHRLLMFDIWERDIAHITKKQKLSKSDQLKLKETHTAGEYRKCKLWVGQQGGTYYKQIPRLMRSLEQKMKHISEPSLSDIWDIHHEFETIHPFTDGNGRTGRLLLNWLSLKHLNRFMIIEGRKRGEYYGEINEFRDKFRKENPDVGFYKDRK